MFKSTGTRSSVLLKPDSRERMSFSKNIFSIMSMSLDYLFFKGALVFHLSLTRVPSEEYDFWAIRVLYFMTLLNHNLFQIFSALRLCNITMFNKKLLISVPIKGALLPLYLILNPMFVFWKPCVYYTLIVNDFDSLIFQDNYPLVQITLRLHCIILI